MLDSLKTVKQKKISAYQLFKILQGSKVKSKVKYESWTSRIIFYKKFQHLKEKEQEFYLLFWEIMDFQKASVKIEGLKLLGYLTSEYLQAMSQVINHRLDVIYLGYTNSKF